MSFSTASRATVAAGVAGLPAGALSGVRQRRVAALPVDLALACTLVSALWVALIAVTLGLALMILPPQFPVVAFFYNGLTVSGRSMATPGMRPCALQLRMDATGARVPFSNAALHAVLLYLSWAVPAILLAPLFTRDKRCLHDMLAGVIVVRRL